MEFSPRKTKSNIYCSVYSCKSKACTNETVRFFHFPVKDKSVVKIVNKFNEEETVDRLTAWEKVLKIGKKVTLSMRVCSLHFMPNDFIPSNHRIHRLKNIAVPSVNLPSSKIEKKPSLSQEFETASRATRLQRRNVHKEVDSEEQYMRINEAQENFCPVHEKEEKEDEEFNDQEQNNESVIKIDIGIQVNSDFITEKFWSFIHSDTELSTATGIPNMSVLNTIENLVKKILGKQQNFKLDLRDTIIMTFMRLKQNMSYAMLALLFKSYTASSCKMKIIEMIKVLYICLKPAIFWPSVDNIRQNMPQCFEGFEDVRVVLDCIEIHIQKPKRLCCQIMTYSHYKTSYTIKFMTGVTPAGILSFISKAYGGRSSDKAIFEQSDILQILEKGNAIMVDRGFTVKDICKKNDVKVIMPPFLQDKKQFSKNDALLTRKIATARVHIERTNQRLKTFAILNAKMPSCLLSVGEEIFTIICAIVNLSAPILKMDKF